MVDEPWARVDNAIGLMRQEMQKMLSEIRQENREAMARLTTQFDRSEERLRRLELAALNKDQIKNDFVAKDVFGQFLIDNEKSIGEIERRIDKIENRNTLTWAGMWGTVVMIAGYVGLRLLGLLSNGPIK